MPAKKRKAKPEIDFNEITVMRGGMPRTLGMRVTSVTKRKVIGEMPISDIHLNHNGRVNGGAIMAFADAMGAVGTVYNLPPGHLTTTLESKTNFFVAGAGPVIKGESRPLHLGRSTNVWQTTLKNADGRVVAIVTQTQMVLAPRPDAGGAKR